MVLDVFPVVDNKGSGVIRVSNGAIALHGTGNTSAGVINVVSKRPLFDFGSQVELSGGNYGAMEGSASITGPFSETVAGRLYVAARERDGTIDVVTGPGPRTEDEDFDRSYYTARGQLLIKPSEAFDLRRETEEMKIVRRNAELAIQLDTEKIASRVEASSMVQEPIFARPPNAEATGGSAK